MLPAHAGVAETPIGTAGRATPNVTPLAHLGSLRSGVSGAFLDKRTYVLSVADIVWDEVGATPKPVTGALEVYDTTDLAKPRLEGKLRIPNYQNEDISVSAKRHFAVMSQDAPDGAVNIVDLTKPTKPALIGSVTLPSGYGHTSTLVDGDRYLWVSGGDQVVVVDVRDLRAPHVVGAFSTPVGLPGPSGYTGVHDAEVDRFGDITVYGGNGAAVYTLTSNPLKRR